MKDQLKHILRLVRKTGDTMIVTDPNGEDVYVVMGLNQYEDLKAGEFLDKGMTDEEWDCYQEDRKKEDDWIWGGGPIDEELEEKVDEKNPDIWNTMQKAGDEGETWDMAKISEPELQNLKEQYKTFAAQTAEEVAPETPRKNKENKDDFGEEQFYLEPID